MSGLRRLVLPVDKKDYNDDMPLYPGLMLTAHVTTVAAQAGAIGGMLVSPLTWIKLRRSFAPRRFWRFTLPRSALRGSLVGAVVGLGMTVGRASMLDSDAIIDRGYRSTHNTVNRNLFLAGSGGTLVGGILGALGGVVSPFVFLKAARGSAVGAGVGTLGLVGWMMFQAHNETTAADNDDVGELTNEATKSSSSQS